MIVLNHKFVCLGQHYLQTFLLQETGGKHLILELTTVKCEKMWHLQLMELGNLYWWYHISRLLPMAKA